MRKITALLLCFMLVFPLGVSADINVEIKDALTDTVRLYGLAPSGEDVVAFVVENASDVSALQSIDGGEIISSAATKVLYSDKTEAKNGEYEFVFSLKDALGNSSYKVILAVGNAEKQVGSFSFYPNDVKQSFIEANSSGEITGDEIETAILVFSLKSYLPTSMADYSKCGDILENLRSELGGFPINISDGTYNTDEFIKIIKKAFVIAALNDSKSGLFDDDGKFIFASDTNIVSFTNEYQDYLSNLNDDGYLSVKNGISGKNISNSADLDSKFKSLVHLNVLTNYAQLGSEHVPGYLTKYNSVYVSAGFNMSALTNCGHKTSVYGSVSSSSASTLPLLASVFNTAIANNPNGSDDGTDATSPGGNDGFNSPGNSGGSSGSGGGLGYVPPAVPNVPQGSYSDVPQAHWAYSYIDSLSDLGIINGKGDGSFAPDDNVKRGEFAKMIALAAKLTPNEEQCTFTDTKLMWSAPYVGAAVAAGLISGISENEFAPENEITREQAAAIIGRALSLSDNDITEVFSDDAKISDWAREYVYALKKEGILLGRENNMFFPEQTLTRAEAAKLIFAAYERLN